MQSDPHGNNFFGGGWFPEIFLVFLTFWSQHKYSSVQYFLRYIYGFMCCSFVVKILFNSKSSSSSDLNVRKVYCKRTLLLLCTLLW